MQWDNSSASIDGGILKRKNAKIENTTSHKDLFVFGYAAKIFRDDPKAIIIDQGKHLLEWNGEKIDRYDVRATLLDSSQFETPPGGYGNRLDYLPPEELRAEQLAEEERYYALKHNEEEELMYQEEEIKRLLHEKCAAYGQVSFDYNAELANKSPEDTQNDNLTKSEEPEKPYIPPMNFNIPYSILLPDTMNQHIIIEKTARFISGQGPQMEILIKAKQSNNPKFEFLNQSNRFNPYYKFLLESIKNGTYPEYQIFESEKNENKYNNTHNNLDDTANTNSELNISEPVIPNIVYKPSPNCAYTQLISKIKGVPLPEITNSIENSSKSLIQETNVGKNSPNFEYFKNSSSNSVEIKKISSGLMLTQAYASDSDNESDNCEENNSENIKIELNADCLMPPESIQTVIDKTATYVVKNGKQFEETLRQKGDERFLFLNKDNEFYSYYIYKLNVFSSNTSSQTKKKQITPVSFSIKSKEETNVQIKPALPQEGSDDELQNKNNNQNEIINKTNNIQCNQQNSTTSLPEHVKRAIQLVENQLVARSVKANNIQVLLSGNIPPINNDSKIKSNITHNFSDKPSLNAISSTQALNQKSYIERQKELKLAEEKVKDRLAQIAREKLGLISKEKQLQLERKKKAIAFLNHIKDSKISTNIIKSKEKDNNKEESDNDSVHSIPIASYESKNEVIKDTKSTSATSELTVPSCTNKILQNIDNDAKSTSTIDSDNSISAKNKVQYSSSYVKSKSRSRSGSRSKSRSRKRKKSKHERHHSKKKSKRKSKNRDHSRTHSVSPLFEQYKHQKSTFSKKSKKHKREKDR